MRFQFFVGVTSLSVLSGLLQAQGGIDDVTILRSDERSLVFEYKPRYLAPKSLAGSGQEFLLADFIGSIPMHNAETVGSPDIRFAMVPVGFPSAIGNAVQVTASDYQDIPNVLFAPVPTLRVNNEVVEIKAYNVNAARYSQNQFLPGTVTALPPVDRMRSMFLGSVRIFPIQYNPATRTLRKYSRIVVEIVFGVSTGNRVQNTDDQPFNGVLLNYNQAKNWRFADARFLGKTTTGPSVLASGSWYRLSVIDEGVYILNAQFLTAAGISLSDVDPRTIKIYGNGGTEVPEDITQPRSTDLVENAVYVEGEADGRFDAGDYVLFYGKSVRGWNYNSSLKTLNHYINHYSEVNYYWLTFGGAQGKRMQTQPSLSENPTVIPDRFLDGVFVEEERVNLLSSGKDWYGSSLNPGSSVTYTSSLPGLIPNQSILYRYLVVARSNLSPSFTVKQAGSVLGIHRLGIVSYESPFTYATASPYDYSPEGIPFQVLGTSSLTNNTSQLNFAFSSPSISGTGWIDWVEILYPRKYEVANNFLRFRSPDTTGIVEYQLQQFSAAPMILNVTRPTDVRRITGAAGSYSFRAAESSGLVSEYCAAAPNTFKTPVAFDRIPNQDLHGYSGGADFIIVTSREFRSAADQLARYRQQPTRGNLRTYVADVGQIYNEFGAGIPDVTAIRDFLKYAYDNWNPRPRYVLMFGQASYDYKGIAGARSSYVPTWESLESREDVGSYATDDFYAKFGPGNALWLILGRISSRTAAEANLAVEKIKRYEGSSIPDAWKMRMVFIGDDSWTSEGEDGTIHSEAAEQLARYYTPDEFEKKKIYIAEYPTVQTAQGRRKPGAYQAIIDQINQGVLTVNFTGHGNPTVWTHEAVFSVQTSIPQLTNANKLSFFFAATCNFSQFDDPRRYTGSELLINKPDGGAIGVVSATRKVFAGSNNYLHQSIYRELFRRDQLGHFANLRVSTALYTFKGYGGNDVNDQKFFVMGDPTMELQYPKGYASIDSVNQEPVDSANGIPRVNPIQLRALSKVTVKGMIRGQDNQTDTSVSGRVSLTLNDASRTITIVNFAPGIDWSYLASGGTVYRGENTIAAGRFLAEFIVPKDISYADSTTRGRLVAYFYSNDLDGAGYTNKINISGTNPFPIQDVTGPSMRLFLDSRNFRDGDLVGEQPLLLVDLVDSSGINTSVSGVGHRIEMWVNNGSQSKDITDFYLSSLDSYREGTVQYQLRGLPQGRNSLRVRAWDTYNNATSAETFFEVASTDQLRISDVLNYPNPFARGTTFTFKQNQSTSLNVTIKIFTLAGRLIQSLEQGVVGEPFVRIPWDGRDRDGDILANGVYLYKVIARTVDSRFSNEALGKLSILK